MHTGTAHRRTNLGLPVGRSATATKAQRSNLAPATRSGAHLPLLPSKRHRAETPFRKGSGQASGVHARLPVDVLEELRKNKDSPQPSEISSVLDHDGTAALAFAGSIFLVAGARLLYRGAFPSVFDTHRSAPYLAVHTESNESKRTHVLACAHFGKLVWLINNDSESSRTIEGSIPLMEEETITSVAVSDVAGLVGSSVGNMYLVRFSSSSVLTVEQLEKPTSFAGQLFGYTQTMTKAMWSLLGSTAAGRAHSGGSSVIRVISTETRDSLLPCGMLVMTERSLMMWTMSANEHGLLWEDNLQSRLEREVDESGDTISATVHLLDVQVIGPSPERHSFVVAVLTGSSNQQHLADLHLHTLKCTLSGNQPPEPLQLFRFNMEGLPLAVFQNQQFQFRTDSVPLNSSSPQSQFSGFLVAATDGRVQVSRGKFPLGGERTTAETVPFLTSIPAATLVDAQCILANLVLLTDDGTLQSVGEVEGGRRSGAETPATAPQPTPTATKRTTPQAVRQPNIIREVEDQVEHILKSEDLNEISASLLEKSTEVIDEPSAGSQWLDGGRDIELQFVSKSLVEKKRRHDTLCLALQRQHAWRQFEEVGYKITDNAEKLAAMAVLHDMYGKRRYSQALFETINSILSEQAEELKAKGLSVNDHFFSHCSGIQHALVKLCDQIAATPAEEMSEEKIACTAEILRSVMRAAIDERQNLHANFSCRYSARHSWVASEDIRIAVQQFFQAAKAGFESLATHAGGRRDRPPSSMQNRSGLVAVLADLARLHFDSFEDLKEQHQQVDNDYEKAKEMVFDTLTQLEILQGQPTLALLRDERKKLAVDFLYFEGMLACTYDDPQQLAKLIYTYHNIVGTNGSQFAEFAFDWLEERQRLHTLLQVAEAAQDEAGNLFENRPDLGWLFHLGREDDFEQVAEYSQQAAHMDASVGTDRKSWTSVADQKTWASVSRLALRLIPSQDQRRVDCLGIDQASSNKLGLIEVHEFLERSDDAPLDARSLVEGLLERSQADHIDREDRTRILGRALAVVEMADGVEPTGRVLDDNRCGDWELVKPEWRAQVVDCWTAAVEVDLPEWQRNTTARMEGAPDQMIRDYLVEETVFGNLVASWYQESAQGKCAQCLQVDIQQLAELVQRLGIGDTQDRLRDLLGMVADACVSSEAD